LKSIKTELWRYPSHMDKMAIMYICLKTTAVLCCEILITLQHNKMMRWGAFPKSIGGHLWSQFPLNSIVKDRTCDHSWLWEKCPCYYMCLPQDEILQAPLILIWCIVSQWVVVLHLWRAGGSREDLNDRRLYAPCVSELCMSDGRRHWGR